MAYDELTDSLIEDDDEALDREFEERSKNWESPKPDIQSPTFDAQPIAKVITPGHINKKLILSILAGIVITSVAALYLVDKKPQEEVKVIDDAYKTDVPRFQKRSSSISEATNPSGSEDIAETEIPVSKPIIKQAGYQQSNQPVTTQQYSSNTPYDVGIQDEIETSPLQKQITGLKTLNTSGYTIDGNEKYSSGNNGVINSTGNDLQNFVNKAMKSSAMGNVTNATTSYDAQNKQDNKGNFYSSGREEYSNGGYLPEDTIWIDTVIPAILINGINTDLPGDLQARVTENVYDSKTGLKLLIPQGSRLSASYNSNLSFAQERVQVAWNTLTRTDGYQVSLGNMNGVDLQGYSGYKGKMDEHLFKWVQTAGLITAFTVLNSEMNYSAKSLQNQTLQSVVDANQATINQLGASVIDRVLDIQPTVTVKPGTAIKIQLNKNLSLPPLEDYEVSKQYVR